MVLVIGFWFYLWIWIKSEQSTPKFELALFFFFGDLGKFDPASGGNGSGWVLDSVQDAYSMGQLLTWL